MKMKNKILLFLVFLVLSSCGYEAIYSEKNQINYNFSISELNFKKDGDRQINLKLKEKLNRYAQNQKNNDFKLKILSASKKSIIAKDNAGDATNFKIEITVDIEVLKNNNLKINFTIIESFDYNNNSDKFELKNYEKEIKNNLSNTVSNQLILKLSNIR
jgi:outer membrane lipopolysaccharide assembly protein LptE/RlpB